MDGLHSATSSHSFCLAMASNLWPMFFERCHVSKKCLMLGLFSLIHLEFCLCLSVMSVSTTRLLFSICLNELFRPSSLHQLLFGTPLLWTNCMSRTLFVRCSMTLYEPYLAQCSGLSERHSPESITERRELMLLVSMPLSYNEGFQVESLVAIETDVAG